MKPSVLLVSTNLAVPWIAPELREFVTGCSRAVVIGPSGQSSGSRDVAARLAAGALAAAGVAQVETAGVRGEGWADDGNWDCVCLAGGNPYDVLCGLREGRGADVINELAADGRRLVAAGLAGCALGRTLAHLPSFGPCLAAMGCRDQAGLGLLPFSLLPHANRWRAVRRDFTADLALGEARHGRIRTLDDDEVLVTGPRGERTVRAGVPA